MELARSAPERIKDAKLRKALERSVTTYGAINFRTYGTRAIMVKKIEKPRDAKSQWDIYRFEPDRTTGELVYVSKH